MVKNSDYPFYVRKIIMKSHIANGQIISDLTTTTEGNALIMRKGRTSLLSAKVMLFALLKVENRGVKHYGIKEQQYYNKLQKDTTVDYTKGLVAEIDVPDIRKLLKKEKKNCEFLMRLGENLVGRFLLWQK